MSTGIYFQSDKSDSRVEMSAENGVVSIIAWEGGCQASMVDVDEAEFMRCILAIVGEGKKKTVLENIREIRGRME